MIILNQEEKKLLNNYKFIDLFAGIGGFHLALASFGASCVFASEWDQKASEIYQKNFNVLPQGDLSTIQASEIPEHQILCAGFPCQAFSISGKQQGFQDLRGTLFFEIARILEAHQPPVLLLENVKNLTKHDEGKTFATILNTLKALNYNVYYQVLNSSDFGLPQNRERVFIVGFHQKLSSHTFQFPQPLKIPIALSEILEEEPQIKPINRTDLSYTKPLKSVKLFENISHNKPIQIGKVNKGGQGERIYDISGHAITLSAYGGGVGAKTGLYLVDGKIRKLTPRECARLQGFPEDYQIHENSNQAYQQFGNSVSVNVLQYIVKEIIKVLKNNER